MVTAAPRPTQCKGHAREHYRVGTYCVAFEEFVHKGTKNFNEWMRSTWAVDPKKVYRGFDIDNPAQDGYQPQEAERHHH